MSIRPSASAGRLSCGSSSVRSIRSRGCFWRSAASLAGSSARVAVGNDASRTLPVSSAAAVTSAAFARSSAASTSWASGRSVIGGAIALAGVAIATVQRTRMDTERVPPDVASVSV